MLLRPIRSALWRYEELGVNRCIVGLNPEKRDAILPILDHWTAFMRVRGTEMASK